MNIQRILYVSVLLLYMVFCVVPVQGDNGDSADDIHKENLHVEVQWPNWNDRNPAIGHDRFLPGELMTLYVTVSGFSEDQKSDSLEIGVSIWDSSNKKLLFKQLGTRNLTSYLSNDPNRASGQASRQIVLRSPLPTDPELVEGDYRLKVDISDIMSGRTGEGVAEFHVLPKDTFMISNARFVLVNVSVKNGQYSFNVDGNYMHSGYLFPLSGIPGLFFKVNGYATDEHGHMNLKVHLIQHSKESNVIHAHTYDINSVLRESKEAYPMTLYMHNNYPGIFTAEVRVEDLNSGKTITQKFPYYIVGDISTLASVPANAPKTEKETSKPEHK